MTFLEQTTTSQVTLPTAADAVRDVIAQKIYRMPHQVVCFGGGCSGFQYGLALDNNIRAEDLIIETNGIRLVIDEVSIKYLEGVTVDYVEGMTTSGFKIINPNVVSSCGCGQSFSSSDDCASDGCAGCANISITILSYK
jgi:iron-sulfur cluster assembly protein